MDDKKDLQRSDQLSRFLDGHVIQTNPFGRNVSAERAYRRAERLTGALHLLTNHVPSSEPSCLEMRRTSIELLSNLLDLRDDMRVSTAPAFRQVQASIRKLITLVRVLTIAGQISLQNAGAVIEALDELGNFLESSQRSVLSGGITLSKDDLLGTETIQRRVSSRTVSEEGAESIKDRESKKDVSDTAKSLQNSKSVLDRRAQAILDVLKNQDSIGIKDISSNLPEYSEKMVQRELAHLIEIGRIKKLGFKRWSRYSLVR